MDSVLVGEFEDACLILVGHGSTLNEDSSAPTRAHAEALRKSGLFGQVLEAYWKEEPLFCGVLRGVWKPRVFIVPLFISDGYFTLQVIPREMGFPENPEGPQDRVRQHGGKDLRYCLPIGTHPGMSEVILGRATGVLDEHPFPFRPSEKDTALFVVGHGTGNSDQSRVAIERQAEILGDLGIFPEVRAVFMEEEPYVKDIYTLTSLKNIVVVPFFVSDGLHSHEDIPVLMGEPEARVRERHAQGQPTWQNPTGRHGKRVWYSRGIGLDPGIPDVILERVREAAAW